jgi:hypothetical protein
LCKKRDVPSSSTGNYVNRILKSLLTVVLLKKIKEEIDANTVIQTYHKPALIVFTGSVAKTDSDLDMILSGL